MVACQPHLTSLFSPGGHFSGPKGQDSVLFL